MKVGYQYRGNIEYFEAVIDRQYRQGPWLLRLPVQFGIVGAVLAAAMVATTNFTVVAQAILFVVTFGLVVTIGIWATKRGLMMKFKSRPGFESEVTVTLSDSGVTFGSNGANQHWNGRLTQALFVFPTEFC
jgi:uncharacterized membrane protein